MEVTKTPKGFTPVTVTLESDVEVFRICRMLYETADHPATPWDESQFARYTASLIEQEAGL